MYTHCYLTCEVPVGGASLSLDADAAMASSNRTLVRPCAFVPREVHTITLHFDTGTLELRGSLDAPFRFLAPLTLFTHSARSYLPATAAASSIVREDMTFRITKQRIQEQEERARKLQAELEATKQELERMKQQSQLMYSFAEMRNVPRCTKEAAPKAPKRESNRKRLRKLLASDDDDDDNGEVEQLALSEMSDEEEENTEKKEKQKDEAEAKNKATARTTQANARVNAHAIQLTPAIETEVGGGISLTKVLAMANAMGINIRDPNIEAARRRRKTSKVRFYLGLIRKKKEQIATGLETSGVASDDEMTDGDDDDDDDGDDEDDDDDSVKRADEDGHHASFGLRATSPRRASRSFNPTTPARKKAKRYCARHKKC